ncbi:hypothetical protein SLG_35330 [Sphingobium sp. SYK-6]|uniref:hypothetical protein n=1 Tax=Sphingobium sp. (strain NBRC 103272 / SYK-6) TaxID=627192 RepID=UPI0002277B93|nr:hypothetical protein [Sphingobium sp. SYK-6]BAK68208.1 hypothetical protein SLG_35330 [Sphingobium sp. SYK-6]
MKIRFNPLIAASAAVLLVPAAAQAEGFGAEATYARANERWGTEIGAGYAVGFAGFRLTPGAGVYLRDGDTAVYGRVEATFGLPASVRFGAGVRISGDDPRPYATIAMPIFPKVALKGNAGPHYVAAGLTIGY